MARPLAQVIDTLRKHEGELRRRGVAHAAVFGSVARGEATAVSDVDVLVDLDPVRAIGLYEYVDIELFLRDVLGCKVDLVEREAIKPRLRDSILGDAVAAF
jgi:uncharacterized protein